MKKVIMMIFLLFAVSFASTAAKWKAKHVVLIGMDGWGSYSVEKADMPNVKKLMKEGCYTLKMRSVLPSSSAVNWASMFMGAGPELHGYTDWNSRKPELESRELSHYGMFPTIFGLFRDAYPKAEMGYIFEWIGMEFVAEQSAFNKMFQTEPSANNPGGITDEAVAYIKSAKPALLGVIYEEPDGTGHNIGHHTDAYYAKLAEQDKYIGRVVEATKEAGIYDETIFILVADHGGIGKGHGGKTMDEMQIPFIISGKGVKKGEVIDESMMVFDVASTIAYIFDLKQPQVWIGRPAKQVFK